MFMTSLAVFAVAISLFQLGALSVWVTVLSFALNLIVLLALAGALYFGTRFLWRRHITRR